MGKLLISVVVLESGFTITLEAAVYGIPVIFGPKYQKFMEAMQLIEAGEPILLRITMN